MKKLLFGALPLALLCILPSPTMARLDVDVHISLPPEIVFVEPPQLIVLPETNIYVAPEVDVDIFFHDGWWWRSWQGGWYRSRSYNSGWNQYRNVPSFHGQIPSDWRNEYRDRRWRGRQWTTQRISYQQVQRNWDRWERDRYWEKEQAWGVDGLHVAGRSGTNLDVSVSLPPAINFVSPPQLIVLPETYVYVVPDVDVDIYFHDGWWWRPWQGGWYRSRSYNSGWNHYQSVPSFYRDIPSGWRNEYRDRRWRGHQWSTERISFTQVQKNWDGWEKNRHWEKQQNWGVRDLRPQDRPQKMSREVQTGRSGSRYQQAVPQREQYYRDTGKHDEKGNKSKYKPHQQGHDKQDKGDKNHKN